MPEIERPQIDIVKLLDTSQTVFRNLHELSHRFNPEENLRFHPYWAYQLQSSVKPMLTSVAEEVGTIRSFIEARNPITSFEIESLTPVHQLVTAVYSRVDSTINDSLQFIGPGLHFRITASRSTQLSSDSFRSITFESEARRGYADRSFKLTIEEGETTLDGGSDPHLSVKGSFAQVHSLADYEDGIDLKACAPEPFSFLPMHILR